MKKTGMKLITSGIFLLLLFFGLIQLFINGGRYFFPLELLGLVLMAALAFVSFLNYHHFWGKMLLFMVFVLYLGDLVLIWLFKGQLYIMLLLLGLAGFMISIPWQTKQNQAVISPKHRPEELHSQIFEVPQEAKAKEPKTEVKTSFSPGKYVASMQSNQFHEPKCDWAKKIKKERQLWFQNKDEAFEKGFRQHSCLK